MKSIFLAIAFLVVFLPSLSSQSIGITAHGLAYVPYHQDTSFQIGQARYSVQPTPKFSTGFRAEGSFYVPQFCIWSIGFTYMAPRADSVVIEASRTNYGGDDILRTTYKTKIWCIGMRVGIAIPQKWNDFLSIMVGAGVQGGGFRRQNTFPDSSPYGTTESDYEIREFEKQKESYGAGEACLMLFYDFERFTASLQYSAYLSLDENLKRSSRHGLNIGLHSPLVNFGSK